MGHHTRRPFEETRWSIVRAARGGSTAAREAFGELCSAYWSALYGFLRRRGHAAADAEDIVQDFLARCLEKDAFALADEDRGRFRTFLLTALVRHVGRLRDKAGALKRGGGVKPLSLDVESGEARFQLEASWPLSPEATFERQFAHALLARAREATRVAYVREDPAREERYRVLSRYLDDTEPPSHRVSAIQLGMSETSVKVAVHRLRAKLRDALRAEVAHTVNTPDEIDDELRHLIAALRSES